MAAEKNSIPSFYSGFLKLFSGLALVQVLNFVFSLVLPRFYSPDDYAFFGVFTAIAVILAEINTLKLDVTIFLPEKDTDALEIVHVIFFICVGFSVLVLSVSIVISFFYNIIYILIAFFLVIYGMGQGLSAWFNRKKDYKTLNAFRIIQSLSTPLLSLLFIIVCNWHFGLIIGFVLGQLLGILYLFYSFRHFDITLMNRQLAKKYLRRYHQFPKYGVISSLVNSVSKNSIILFIKYFFGALNAGYYTLTSRVLSIPGGMYQAALSQIYLQQASMLDNYSLKMYTKKIVWFGFVLGILPVILVLFFGQPLFAFIFGTKWLMAGKMAQYIVLWFFFQVLIGPVGFMLDIKQKLRFELGWNVILLIFRMSAILVGILINDLFLMLILITVVSVLMNLFLLRYVLKLTNDVAS